MLGLPCAMEMNYLSSPVEPDKRLGLFELWCLGATSLIIKITGKLLVLSLKWFKKLNRMFDPGATCQKGTRPQQVLRLKEFLAGKLTFSIPVFHFSHSVCRKWPPRVSPDSSGLEPLEPVLEVLVEAASLRLDLGRGPRRALLRRRGRQHQERLGPAGRDDISPLQGQQSGRKNGETFSILSIIWFFNNFFHEMYVNIRFI